MKFTFPITEAEKRALYASVQARFSEDQPRDEGHTKAALEHLDKIKEGILKMADAKNKDWGHVGSMEHYSSQLKDVSDSLHQTGEYARSASDPAVEVRFSEDQPRDDHGRFSSGGEHSEPIGKTASGKDIPGPGHGVYNDRQKMPKYNGPVSPALAHGRDGGKMLRKRMPEFTKQDHLDAHDAHLKAADALDKKWGETADKAAKETFGRPYQATDYKISGIASDKFSEASKDKLRDLAHTASAHREAATAHLFASQYMRGQK